MLGVALIILAASCFATLGPLTRFAEDAGMSSIGLVAWRSALGAVLILGLLAVRRLAGRRETVPLGAIPGRDRWMLLLAAISTTTLNLAIFIAFVRISIALSLLVFYLYPALVALASVAWFGERLDRPRWTALGLSLAGMVLVVAGPMLTGGSIGSLDALGIGLAFTAAISQVVYVLAARHGYGSVPSIQAVSFFLAFGGAAQLLIALVSGNADSVALPFAEPDTWLIVALAGTIGAGIPTLAYLAGIRLIGAPRAAILSTTEPVIGTLLAALLLAEVPTPVQVAGGVLIVVAAVLLQLRPRAAAVLHGA